MLLTQEKIEAVFAGEVEYVATSKMSTVGGIEAFRTNLGIAGRHKKCSYCTLAQRVVEFRYHCIACGQPCAIK